jgi:hypothetical protein
MESRNCGSCELAGNLLFGRIASPRGCLQLRSRFPESAKRYNR